MSYKASSFFQDILVNEYFYIATKSKQLIRHEILGKDVICVWTQKETAETFLNKHDTDYDKIKKIDIDRFVTYEMDDVFAEEIGRASCRERVKITSDMKKGQK